MKLINFKAGEDTYFGMAVEGFAVSFAALQRQCGKSFIDLESIYTYLAHLPQSFEQASELGAAAGDLVKAGGAEGVYPISEIRILAPIQRPAALLDFGLSPRHLVNSARTMLKHEFGPLVSRIVTSLLEKRIHKMSNSPVLPYYKGNHLSVIGDYDEIGWPSYTSYLDIEPELAVLTGTPECKVAGYMIFNDASARDIQFPEMIGSGPARAKDFVDGNGLGPFLVTPDEIPAPLSLSVTARIGTRYIWKGSTSEYTAHPEKLVNYFEGIFSLVPGVVLGMGTVPGCTGLDNDAWVEPGDLVEITIDGLGTLHQRIPAKPGTLEKSRWKQRF